MKTKIENGIEYLLKNDIWYPNLMAKEEGITLGKYGRMRKMYMEEYKKWLNNRLVLNGELYAHCKQVEDEAKYMFDMEYRRLCNSGYSNVQAAVIAEELISQYVVYA